MRNTCFLILILIQPISTFGKFMFVLPLKMREKASVSGNILE